MQRLEIRNRTKILHCKGIGGCVEVQDCEPSLNV